MSNTSESFKEWIKTNWIDSDDPYIIKDVQKEAYQAGQESCKDYKLVVIDGREYINKDIADKRSTELAEDMVAQMIRGEQEAFLLELEKIVKPIRDVFEGFKNDYPKWGIGGKTGDELWQAIRETLERIDK